MMRLSACHRDYAACADLDLAARCAPGRAGHLAAAQSATPRQLVPVAGRKRSEGLRKLGLQRLAILRGDAAEYWYTPGYYAVFFYDPGAIKLELLHRPAYWEWWRSSPR